MKSHSQFLTTAEAADYLKVARQTLACWRLKGRGPNYSTLGRKVVYDKAVLDSFVTSHMHSSTSEY